MLFTIFGYLDIALLVRFIWNNSASVSTASQSPTLDNCHHAAAVLWLLWPHFSVPGPGKCSDLFSSVYVVIITCRQLYLASAVLVISHATCLVSSGETRWMCYHGQWTIEMTIEKADLEECRAQFEVMSNENKCCWLCSVETLWCFDFDNMWVS